MKRSYKIVVGVVTAAGLGLTAAALYAQPGPMGGGMGPGMGLGMMQHGGPAGPSVGQQLMTPEERQALADKMRNAKTPEERQKLAEANRAEMEKRAKEKGITLPEHRGPHFAPPFAGPTR